MLKLCDGGVGRCRAHMATCAYVRRNGPRRSLTYGVPPAATPAPVLRSMPAQAFSSSTRRTIPGSATSASRICRASCKSFAGISASRQPGNFSISEKLGLPALAISPRSCAASYSSARRRLAPAMISIASACVRCAAAKQNPRRYRRQGQHVYEERRAVLHSVAPQGPCLMKEARGRTNCPAYIVGAACPLCPGQARASRSAPWRRVAAAPSIRWAARKSAPCGAARALPASSPPSPLPAVLYRTQRCRSRVLTSQARHSDEGWRRSARYWLGESVRPDLQNL